MTPVQNCDPERPWGYWLRQVTRSGAVDAPKTGTRYNSVRDALWGGRLNSCFCVAYEEHLDLLLETLISINIGFPRMVPDRLMVGDGLFFRHYMYWLNATGLVAHGKHPLDRPRLTDEAKSIVLLLKQTHPLAVEVGYEAAISDKDRLMLLGPAG